MLSRSLYLLPLFAGSFLAGPAAADRLFVAGSSGVVMQAQTRVGQFEYFACQCAGPINVLAADESRLYAADDFGQLLVFDLDEGAMLGLFAPGIGTINSLAAADGAIFAGTDAGTVVRMDPATGQVVEARTTPDGVRAMLAYAGYLYIGSTNGGIYRADAAGGEFEYFSCFCFFNIQTLVVDRGDLVVADEFGTVVRVNAQTGELLHAFSLFGSNVMAVSDGALLLYYDGGVIPLASAMTGASLPGGFTSPIDVRAMLVIDTPTGPKRPLLRSGRPRAP